jgi:putative SOS response-associated peptidase YedK
MCNLYEHNVAYRQFVDEFSQLKLPLVFPPPSEAPNLEPRQEIRPTDLAPVIRPRDEGVELVRLKWGFRPGAPKRPPIINFRSEGRRFGQGRCLVPASAFFEFTGEKYPKTRWRFTDPAQAWFCFAGLWRRAEGDWPESFTLLTCAPGEDVAPYHGRQPIPLAREDWAKWLDPAADGSDLLHAAPKGALAVVEAPRDKQQA